MCTAVTAVLYPAIIVWPCLDCFIRHKDGTEWTDTELSGNEKIEDTVQCVSTSGYPGHASVEASPEYVNCASSLFGLVLDIQSFWGFLDNLCQFKSIVHHGNVVMAFCVFLQLTPKAWFTGVENTYGKCWLVLFYNKRRWSQSSPCSPHLFHRCSQFHPLPP